MTFLNTASEARKSDYADWNTRFTSFVCVQVHQFPSVEEGDEEARELLNDKLNDVLQPFVRAIAFLALITTRNESDAHTNIDRAVRPIIKRYARLTADKFRGVFLISIDLDSMPYVEPVNFDMPFEEAMQEMFDRLEADYQRFARAKDIAAIERMLLAYAAPIGRFLGFTGAGLDMVDETVRVMHALVARAYTK